MTQAAVYDILDQIEKLPAEARLLLDELLAEQQEAEWHREANLARQSARERGIDEETIDRAVQGTRADQQRSLGPATPAAP